MGSVSSEFSVGARTWPCTVQWGYTEVEHLTYRFPTTDFSSSLNFLTIEPSGQTFEVSGIVQTQRVDGI